MPCDMCGSEGKLFKAVIEGTELTVCNACSGFGKIISRVRAPVIKKKASKAVEAKKQEDEVIQVVVRNYSEIIRKKRESVGMKQEEFAKKLSEKESIIHKIETGHYKPSIEMAQKLEKLLKIRLIEELKETTPALKRSHNEGFTIGDLIKVNKKD